MNRIKSLREENDITQEELARKLGKSKGIISLYEKEDRKPSLEILLKLAEIFNCSIDYILCKTDVRNTDKKSQEDPLGLAKVGFNMDDYTPPTDKQREQIRDILEIMLKDNKKDKK